MTSTVGGTGEGVSVGKDVAVSAEVAVGGIVVWEIRLQLRTIKLKRRKRKSVREGNANIGAIRDFRSL
jgi:hypothetical protein